MIPKKTKGPVRNEAHEVLIREIIFRLAGRAKVWKQSTGATMIGERFIRFGVKGAADITGLLKGGVRLEVEVKTGSARQTPHQVEYQKMIEAMGGIYLVARDGEEFINQLEAICQERGIRF